MRKEQIGSKQAWMYYHNDFEVLVSYDTPVAGFIPHGVGYVKTEEYYSKTTSRHINYYLKYPIFPTKVKVKFLREMFSAMLKDTLKELILPDGLRYKNLLGKEV